MKTFKLRGVLLCLLTFLLLSIGFVACTPTQEEPDVDFFIIEQIGEEKTLVNLTSTGSRQSTLSIPDDINVIGQEAMMDNRTVTSITFGEGSQLARIAASAFEGTSNLISFAIPSSVTEIEDEAFMNSGLTSIILPASLEELGQSIFEGCSHLTSVTFEDDFKLTSIGFYTFQSCSALTSITIPPSVTEISGSAFWGCTALTSITIPSTVTSIGMGAFSGCSGLTSVEILANIKTIHLNTFKDCTSLTTLTLPEGLEEIEIGAFENCTELLLFQFPSSLKELSGWAFKNTAAWNRSSNQTGSVIYINNWACGINGVPTQLEIKEGTVGIASAAFMWEESITRVSLPDTLKIIASQAFDNCTNMTTITIPSAVEYIGAHAFRGWWGETIRVVGKSADDVADVWASSWDGEEGKKAYVVWNYEPL